MEIVVVIVKIVATLVLGWIPLLLLVLSGPPERGSRWYPDPDRWDYSFLLPVFNHLVFFIRVARGPELSRLPGLRVASGNNRPTLGAKMRRNGEETGTGAKGEETGTGLLCRKP